MSALIACAVCYGDPSSKLTEGAVAGVGLMIGVVAVVLVGVAGIAVYWARRARAVAALEQQTRPTA